MSDEQKQPESQPSLKKVDLGKAEKVAQDLITIQKWLETKNDKGLSIIDILKKLENTNLYDINHQISLLKEKEATLSTEIESLISESKEDIKAKIEEFVKECSNQRTAIEVSEKNITQYLTQVKSSLESGYATAQKINTTYTSNDTLLKKSQDEWETLASEYETESTKLKTNHELKLKEIQDKMRQELINLQVIKQDAEAILDIATSAGLAKAYQEKVNRLADEIKNQKWIFLGANGLMCIIAFFSLKDSTLSINSISDMGLFLIKALPALAIISPLLWIAKQNGELLRQNIRIREEYEHKKSLVATYNGYKDSLLKTVSDDHLHTEEIHPISSLIQDTTKGIMRNPSDSVTSKHELMPLEEVLKLLIKTPSDKFDKALAIFAAAFEANKNSSEAKD